MNKHVTVLPSSVRGLLDCARYQIEQLENQVTSLSQQDDVSHPRAVGATDGVGADAETNVPPTSDQIEPSETGLSQDELEDAIDDGFMIIDLNTVQTKLEKWNQLFPQVKPYFAMKCNPDPMVVKWLADQHNSVGFDVASWSEIQLALEACGNETSICVEGKQQARIPRLIYANPQRAEQDLKNSMVANLSMTSPLPLWLTLDGPEELVKIYQISRQQNFPISRIALILRILVPDHQSTVPLGEKFGSPLDEIGNLVQHGLDIGFQPSNFIGTSFHCGSGCHDPETYQLALQLTRSALDQIHATLQRTEKGTSHRCSLIDIGGGFPGWDGLGGDYNTFSSGHIGDAEPSQSNFATTVETTSAIAEVIQPSLRAFVSEGYQIIAEPGRFFVEAAAGLVCKIYDKQISENIRVYKIAHGVQGVFKDVLLCDESFPPLPLDDHQITDTSSDDRPRFQSRVLGPLSSSSFGQNDVICTVCDLPEMQVGDWLVFDRMGAYTLSIASRAGRPVICYVEGGCLGGGKGDQSH